jgi:hypothetical protein
MAGPRKLPDVQTLVRKVEKGMTHGEIAAEYGVTRQAVTIKLRGATTPRHYKRDWPWEVQTRHKVGWFYDALTYWVVDKNRERPLGERQRYRLSSFIAEKDKLERRMGKPYVVDYDPDTPVGFYFRPRRPGDPEDSIMGTPEVAAGVS